MSTGTLEGVADAVEAAASEQRQVAKDVRRMERERARGWSWSRILDDQRAATVLERLRGSARRLGEAAGGLSSTVARGLAEEGESHRKIARRLGVTHQRVTAVLRDGRTAAHKGPRG